MLSASLSSSSAAMPRPLIVSTRPVPSISARHSSTTPTNTAAPSSTAVKRQAHLSTSVIAAL